MVRVDSRVIPSRNGVGRKSSGLAKSSGGDSCKIRFGESSEDVQMDPVGYGWMLKKS